MIISAEGAFVPRSVFGEGAEISHQVRHRQDGAIEVSLLGRPSRTESDPATGAPELRWVDLHRSEYAGEWVALDGDRLLAHGPDPRQVYLAARAAGAEIPSLMRVPDESIAPFGGW